MPQREWEEGRRDRKKNFTFGFTALHQVCTAPVTSSEYCLRSSSTVGRTQYAQSLMFYRNCPHFKPIRKNPTFCCMYVGNKPLGAGTYFLQDSIRYRAAGAGGLDFGRLVNPISTRGADYAHHITSCPPDFQTFLRLLNSWYFNVKSSVKR